MAEGISGRMECFCGCGRKVGFTSRGINKNGIKTEEAIANLKVTLNLLNDWCAAYEERGDTADIEATQPLVGTIEKMIDAGPQFSRHFSAAVHGAPLDLRESIDFKAEWLDWYKGSQELRPYWENVETQRAALESYRRAGKKGADGDAATGGDRLATGWHCFCGCGRSVPVEGSESNRGGKLMSREFSKWMKVIYFFKPMSNLEADHSTPFIQDGWPMWCALRDKCHAGDGPGKPLQEAVASWLISSSSMMHDLRDDPIFAVLKFDEFPESSPEEIEAWVKHGTTPEWAKAFEREVFETSEDA